MAIAPKPSNVTSSGVKALPQTIFVTEKRGATPAPAKP